MPAAPLQRRTQGATRYVLLILLALFACAGGVIVWLLRGAGSNEHVVQELAPVADAGQIHRADMPVTTADLLLHARDAMAQQRLLAPAGNNAIEWYLKVLKQQPDNQVAQDALREIFPFAATAAEQTIGQGNAAEAQREIDLLSKADPTNYTLTILRAKLQAQLQVAEDQQRREQQQAQATAQKQQAHTASVTTPFPSVAVTPAPPSAISQPASPVKRTEPEPAAPVAARPAPAAEAVAATAPVLKRRIEPYYPSDARRTRRQGWVDVRFVVEADGSVSRASVIDADPKNVFDRAALSAVERWQFTPGTRNGAPASAELRQRIEFRL
ncbi:protein TonB [Dyella sp. OK004]|uniref:energy transducer TonB n=1 Tax=Dyella sp. OK004 TaxID=1855292 RepID=UPI0008EE9DB6|nr:energy transducer TonB [Dyella sp. OK004]SFR95629.1 protein TonB [Dyella sp. OK004]